MRKRYYEREGHYPQRVLADMIYRNRDNLSYCKLHGIRLSGPALGRPKKDEIRDKRQDYLDQNERIEVERRFSLAKCKCNLGKVKTKLEETIGFTIAMSIVILNLRKIQLALLRLFSVFRLQSGIAEHFFKLFEMRYQYPSDTEFGKMLEYVKQTFCPLGIGSTLEGFIQKHERSLF